MLYSYIRSCALDKSCLPYFFSHTIAAGFPSPADDYCEGTLDLNEFLIHRPASTLFVAVTDNSMSKYGLFKGDLLIVDRSLEVREGSLILTRYQGEQMVRKVSAEFGKININASQINQIGEFPENLEEGEIMGVIKTVIHRFKV